MWSLDEKELVAIHSLTQPARRWPDGERRSAGDRGGRSAGAQGETRQSSTTDAAHLLYRAGAQGETRQVRPRPRACAPGSPPGLFRPRVRVQAASVSPPGLSGVLKKIEFVFERKIVQNVCRSTGAWSLVSCAGVSQCLGAVFSLLHSFLCLSSVADIIDQISICRGTHAMAT